MPRVTAGDVELYYESLGEGLPLVLQAHDHTPWLFGQAPVFSQRYRFLTYDRRGTGRSASPSGDWTPADLANDLAARRPNNVSDEKYAHGRVVSNRSSVFSFQTEDSQTCRMASPTVVMQSISNRLIGRRATTLTDG